MEEFKLYSVSDEYIEYLRKVFPNVYSNKEITRIHTRKYVGTVVCLENYHYYIPMSSPKESDYQIAGEKIVHIKIWYRMKSYLFVKTRKKFLLMQNYYINKKWKTTYRRDM